MSNKDAGYIMDALNFTEIPLTRNMSYLYEALNEIMNKMNEITSLTSQASDYPAAELGMPDPLHILQRQTYDALNEIIRKLKIQRLMDAKLVAQRNIAECEEELTKLGVRSVK